MRRDLSFTVVPGIERLDCLSKFSNIFQEPLGRWRIYVPSTWGRLRDFYRLVCVHVSRKRAEAMLCSRSSNEVKISRREASDPIPKKPKKNLEKRKSKGLVQGFFLLCMLVDPFRFLSNQAPEIA